MSIYSEWMREFNSLEKKLREGSDSNKGYINYSLSEAAPHLERDMQLILRKLQDDAFALMEMSRIKFHIIGMVQREKKLAIFRYVSNQWFKRHHV